MSADNGYIVSRLSQPQDEYGIFYSSGDGEFAFTRENATASYTNPLHAILAAHKLEASVPTEYGVHVRKHVLMDTADYFDYNTNEIVKPLKDRYGYNEQTLAERASKPGHP